MGKAVHLLVHGTEQAKNQELPGHSVADGHQADHQRGDSDRQAIATQPTGLQHGGWAFMVQDVGFDKQPSPNRSFQSPKSIFCPVEYAADHIRQQVKTNNLD